MTRRRFSRQPVVFRNQSEHRSAPRNGNCSNLQIIKEVQDLFDGIFEDELVLDVLEDCNYDKQRATEALFEMGPQARLREQNSVRPAPRQGESPIIDLQCLHLVGISAYQYTHAQSPGFH